MSAEMKIKKSYAAWAKGTPWVATIEGKRRFFKTEADRDAAAKAAEGDRPDIKLTNREYAVWEWCRHQLPPGTDMKHVVSWYLAHVKVDPRMSLSGAVEEYLKEKVNLGRRPRYLNRMKQILNRILREAPDQKLALITPSWVEQLCRSLGTPNVQAGARGHLSMCLAWCVKRGWLTDNPAEARKVTLERPARPVPEFLSVPDAQTVLDVGLANPDLLAAFAIQMFMGVRTSEITQLSWTDLAMGTHLNIPASIAKTGYRRVIDWWPSNLTACLEPVARKIGPIAPVNYDGRRVRAMRAAGITLPNNAFRHSYATYGVALHQEAGKVALMLGHHDANLIHRHYRAYTDKASAERYFALVPRSSASSST